MTTVHRKGSIVIAGYYGFNNAGDELILKSLVQQLRRATPELQITVLSAKPGVSATEFAVKAVSRWMPWQWVGPLWHAELFILGGGGLLQESTGPWNYLYYLSLVLLAKVLGCRTEIRAVGIDPVEREWNRVLTRLVLNHFTDFISVRDAESQRALESIDVYRRLWRVPDLVFQLERTRMEPVPDAAPARIAWALSGWPQRPGWEHDAAHLLDRVASHLGVANELMVFFPAEDEPFARRVAALTTTATTVRTWTRSDELPGAMPEYAMVIGMRYHALVLAALAEKPFIGWGFQRKIRTLCNDFQQPMWIFERGWDSDSVFRQIGDAWSRRGTLPERYKTQLADLANRPAAASESARIFVPTV